MKIKKRHAFPGRVIFDHLPKTAGTSIHAWLTRTLGNGCVTPHLVGNGKELIRRYGGNFSIISGHVHFAGDGLDPRYQYITCLREPIDRALSWLFFTLKEHNTNQISEQWTLAEHFISTQGEVVAPALLGQISNPYINHFASIITTIPCSDEVKLTNAISAIEQYDIYGLMEEMPAFVFETAALIGLPAPQQIERVNVTRLRPKISGIPALLERNLRNLNRLDLEFYRILQERLKTRKRHSPRIQIFGYSLNEAPKWDSHASHNKYIRSVELTVLSATISNQETISLGESVSFIVDFSLAQTIKGLVIGIQILDDDNLLAFGTNSTLLGHPVLNVDQGIYRAHYDLIADLPAGEYKAGFAFTEQNEDINQELAWYDHVLTFRISVPRVIPSIGYTCLPAAFKFQQRSNEFSGNIRDARGTIRSAPPPSKISAGESFLLSVQLENNSTQIWVNNNLHHPINLSYHWLEETGSLHIFEGERTRLTVQDIAPGQVISTQMRILAPTIPGHYQLLLLPVQEMNCWFDERGFHPEILNVRISAAPYATSARRPRPDTAS